jgi:hypothetical protein
MNVHFAVMLRFIQPHTELVFTPLGWRYSSRSLMLALNLSLMPTTVITSDDGHIAETCSGIENTSKKEMIFFKKF